MSKHPMLILGASGQIGKAWVKLLGNAGIGLSHQQFDISKPNGVERELDKYDVSAVINAAAYTLVDKAEQEHHLAMDINCHAPEIIAKWCAKRDIPFVHYSTDYVFSGKGEIPWRENDECEPLNVYGYSKAEGDKRVANVRGKWLIFRSTWIYDYDSKNFLTTFLKLSNAQDEICIVNDQYGAPTYAPHVAAMSLKGLEYGQSLPEFPSGVYHLCHEGVTTWYDFARTILEKGRSKGMQLQVKTVKPISTQDYAAPAKRPGNSRMNTEKAKKVLRIELPKWQLALDECISVIMDG
ncbi:dTDP-4-dehydrorhamnose reductase [candidate division CSSED10-310 bacterium]|uniref:dTDP-4-dehydrorhamnose reductase n=1 Tax=candidate division CSSED10-310 bacterium TaxID=2855610 RepID=A0ABV6YS94_UNCC1